MPNKIPGIEFFIKAYDLKYGELPTWFFTEFYEVNKFVGKIVNLDNTILTEISLAGLTTSVLRAINFKEIKHTDGNHTILIPKNFGMYNFKKAVFDATMIIKIGGIF